MIEIFRLNEDREFEKVATFNSDGTVDGDSFFADYLRNILGDFTIDPATHSDKIETVIEHRYNNSYFATVRD